MDKNQYTTWTVTLEVPDEHSDWFYAQIDATGELEKIRQLAEVDIEYRLRRAVKAAGRSFEVQAKVTQDGE